METLYCACCGRPFTRASRRGPAPLYCSRDCRRQIEVRRRTWLSLETAGGRVPSVVWEIVRQKGGGARSEGRFARTVGA